MQVFSFLAFLKLALDPYPYVSSVCLCLSMYFRPFLVVLLASGSDSGTPLIKLGVLRLDEECHTHVDDLF